MSLPNLWSSEKDQSLLELRAGGLPWHLVAQRLKVGRNSAIERARRLGLKPMTRQQPPAAAPRDRTDRPALPAGHPDSWGRLIAGTSLDGAPYPFPVFL